jgi:hypothetical protein
MDIQRFRYFVQTHPTLLFPAFQLQHALRKRILGVWFWQRAANRRIELTHGKYLPVAQFVELVSLSFPIERLAKYMMVYDDFDIEYQRKTVL